MERTEVVDQAYRSVKWSALASVLPRFITPVSTMILAGLLTPSDFGIVAVAMLVVALAQVVVGLGLGTAVVQRQTAVEEAASIAFGLSVAMAVLLYGALWWLSPVIANFYQIPALVNVIRVAGLTLFLSALVSIPTALLQRRLDFRLLFWIGAVPQIVTAIVSVAFALMGGGYWALVIGQLVGLAINVLLVWRASAWRPRCVFDGALVRSLLVFGLWIMASSFQSWLFLYGDNAIAGYFFGAQGLGVYALGFNIASLFPGMIVAPLAAIAYPAFSALQKDPYAVGRDLLKLQRLVAAILFPACFGLAALATPAVTLLYGDKWSGLGWTLGFLAIMPGAGSLWSLNADAYRAVGRPDVWTKLAVVATLILFPLLFLSGRFDYKLFVGARFAGALVLPLLNLWAATHILRVSVAEQWLSWRGPALCAIAMFAAVTALGYYMASLTGVLGWTELLLMTGVGVAIYAGGLRLIDRSLFSELVYTLGRLGLAQRSR
jgi:O-antigen/teichoic acid export membrane protein